VGDAAGMSNAATPQTCFHCGLPVPPGSRYQVVIDGENRPMCCPGCQAVAGAIVANGLTDFYRYRSETSGQARALVPAELAEMELFDRPGLQQSFVREAGDDRREAALILEGIVCAACVWLNEHHVRALPGVIDFQVNYSTHRARLVWDDTRIKLSAILKAIGDIGYRAHPFDPGRQEQLFKREKSRALRRLGVAGVGMAQVMMIAVALYAGADQDLSTSLRAFLRWVSLLIATPVVFYSARVFFESAWRDLRRRGLGMDVPVSLAIGGAYLASTWATVTGRGEIYFDSVTMFTFFLLAGRYLEMAARHRAGQAAEALVKLMPATATRLDATGEQRVAVAELAPGDRVLIRPGESVPADGDVLEGASAVDESLLTGESLPLRRVAGDRLVGGTVNTESPLIMRVGEVGEGTVLAAIVRLLDRAQTEKPAVAQLADRVAAWFVGVLLVAAVGVALWWLAHDPAQAFRVTLSMLVVTCPCALSLATPAALTAATGALTRLGVLTTRGHALETLARVTHMIFDKTGTLTAGRLRVEQVQVFGARSRDDCLAIAAALEQASEHPLAQAVRQAAPTQGRAEGVSAQAGRGVEGTVGGIVYRVGKPDYVAELTSAAVPSTSLSGDRTAVWLASGEEGWLAVFGLSDPLRPDAAETLETLRRLGIAVELLSGDQETVVRAVAGRLDIAQARARCLPDDKLARIRALQAQGARVAMVGDGVNDAPVLAGADVSIAMGGGTQLAHASADMILLSEQLPHLVEAVRKARRTRNVIIQNLGWALVYNVIAVPLAAAGWIAPWMAALGMSASSLVVVTNALRLR